MDSYYVRVVVHATVPAVNGGTAIDLLAARIRDGIGPDTDLDSTDEREWGTAIAFATALRDGDTSDAAILMNEEFVRRLGTLRR